MGKLFQFRRLKHGAPDKFKVLAEEGINLYVAGAPSALREWLEKKRA